MGLRGLLLWCFPHDYTETEPECFPHNQRRVALPCFRIIGDDRFSQHAVHVLSSSLSTWSQPCRSPPYQHVLLPMLWFVGDVSQVVSMISPTRDWSFGNCSTQQYTKTVNNEYTTYHWWCNPSQVASTIRSDIFIVWRRKLLPRITFPLAKRSEHPFEFFSQC